MMFPFGSLEGDHRELGLVVAVIIGFAFGFVLERAGFGRAPKLAAQFYLRDMTVLKVMFSGIVTAMLGLVVLSGLGLVDLRALAEQAASPTYLWPMIAGGFLLGMGFIIAGYCPGTSVVAAASGNLDGIATLFGVTIGGLAYAEIQPAIQRFHDSGDLGSYFLYDLLPVPPAVIALLVALMAIAAFAGAEKLERLFSGRSGVPPPAALGDPSRRRLAFAGFVALAAVGLATLAVPQPSTAASPRVVPSINTAELTRRILDEPWRVRILDLRPLAECAAQRIPGSECTPPGTVDKLGLPYDQSGKELVLVGASDLGEPPAAALAYPGRVVSLAGGFDGWRSFALTPPPAPSPDAGEAEREAYRLRSGLHAMLTGAKPPPPPPSRTATAPKKKAGGGCGG